MIQQTTSTDPNIRSFLLLSKNQRDLQQRVGELERSTMTLTMQKNKAEQELHQVDESRVCGGGICGSGTVYSRVCGGVFVGYVVGYV